MIAADCFDFGGMPEANQPKTDDRCWNSLGMAAWICHTDDWTFPFCQLVDGCERRLAGDEIADLLKLVANLLWNKVEIASCTFTNGMDLEGRFPLVLAKPWPEIVFIFNFKVFSRVEVEPLNNSCDLTKCRRSGWKSLPESDHCSFSDFLCGDSHKFQILVVPGVWVLVSSSPLR